MGEELNKKQLAIQYGVSEKTISRYFDEIRNCFVEYRELFSDIELVYNAKSRGYSFFNNKSLLPQELLFIIKILIESRAVERSELINIINKLKKFTTNTDKALLEGIISKEIFKYSNVKNMTNDLIKLIWNFSKYISEKREITIEYTKMDSKKVKRTICPIAIVFSEYYFYLIAYRADKEDYKPLYYRIDRVTDVVVHRKQFVIPSIYNFDEGELKEKIYFMTYGEFRKIKFEYTGVGVQAILDKIPTAKIVENDGKKFTIVAEVYGMGINKFLLSQGSNVKVLEPEGLVNELKEEIRKIHSFYFDVEGM